LSFAPNTTPSEREREVDQARERYGAALRRIAEAERGAAVHPMISGQGAVGPGGHTRAPGSADRGHSLPARPGGPLPRGLIRSGAWETHIAETLANLGLPAELAVLPHVESSFNPAAYSKVGAAGLWQFMRSTGRRYMRIDGAGGRSPRPVPPHRGGAGHCSAFNYRDACSWPLALTA